MKAFKKCLIPLAAIAAVVGLSEAVSAQVVLTKDVEGRLYVRTGAARTPIDIEFTNSPVTRRVLANPCGLIVVRPLSPTELPSLVVPPSNISVTPSSLPVEAIPSCVNGTLSIPVTGDFRTTTNSVVLVNQTPNLAVDVSLTGRRTRRFNSNACGVVRVANSASFNIGGAVVINGTSSAISNVPTQAAPLCRRVIDKNILYLPEAPSGGGGVT